MFYVYHHHHHHVVPPARISLTLSRHFSLSFIASGRSSGLHPVFLHSTNYTATCLPSRKLYKLDEPDTQDTAGEARMNPSVMYFYGQGKAGRPCIYIYIYIYIRTLYVHFAYPYQAMVHTGKRFHLLLCFTNNSI